MVRLGVNVAIIDRGRVLLTQRDDFRVWCLPGGGVDNGESLAQAAMREAREETGLEVELTRVVSVYSKSDGGPWGGHVVLFAARPVGGSLNPQAGEVIGMDFFAPDHLPSKVVPVLPRRASEAFSDIGGSVAWQQSQAWPFESSLTRQQIYQRRNDSGLSRSDFYKRYMLQVGETGEVREVPADGLLATRQKLSSPVERDKLPAATVSVAVLQDDRVLLIQREDFEVWCLPGGQVEENESLAQAAKREAQEESGLEIELIRFVGIYSITRRLQHCAHVFLFAARPVGGRLCPQPGEALQARFLAQAEWPEAWLFGQRQQALDALAGIGGSAAWRYCTEWPFSPTITRREIYALRDRSGLSRSEFYYQHFEPFGPGDEILEVGAN